MPLKYCSTPRNMVHGIVAIYYTPTPPLKRNTWTGWGTPINPNAAF